MLQRTVQSATRIRVTWEVASDEEVVGYRVIWQGLNGDAVEQSRIVLGRDVLSFEIEGLVAQTIYQVTVRAHSVSGEGAGVTSSKLGRRQLQTVYSERDGNVRSPPAIMCA